MTFSVPSACPTPVEGVPRNEVGVDEFCLD